MVDRSEDLLMGMFEAQFYWFPVVAEVVTFYGEGPAADVRPLFTFQGTPAPMLLSVPVLMPGGGGWQMNFPLVAGDKVLCIFCAHKVATWFLGKPETEIDAPDLSDGVCIPGLFPQAGGRTVQPIPPMFTITNGALSLEVSAADVKVITSLGSVSVLTHTHTDSTQAGTTGPPVLMQGV